MDKFRPPFRARWCDLLLLLFFVLIIIIIIVIIIIIILSGVRVPLLLLALAPARFSLLSRSLCSCTPLGIEYISVRA